LPGAIGAAAAAWDTDTGRLATRSDAFLAAVVVLTAMVYDSDPGPVRVPPGTVIHEGSPDVVHEHPAPVATLSVPVRPAEVAEIVPGVTANVQVVVVPGCVTVKVEPAIVAVPTRCVVVVFGATFTVALPFPVLPPAAIVSQLALLVAVQAQLLPVATATTVASPAAGDVRVVGKTA
jgi:hypothetical protein